MRRVNREIINYIVPNRHNGWHDLTPRMDNPFISIIVPVYNTELYIRACLNSILSQTYNNWEAILVDDGSTDKSGSICDEYEKTDSRFVVIHKQNEGTGIARITAFEHSKGDLITFIDSDDYVSADFLEILAKPIIEDEADMVSCNFFDVNVETNKITCDNVVVDGSFSGKDLCDFISEHFFYDKSCIDFGIPPMLSTKMVRREYVGQGLNRGLGMWFGEDQVATFSFLYNIKKLCVIPNRLYYWLHYKKQTTQRYDSSLWNSLNKMFSTYEEIDCMKIAEKGLRIRTWGYIFKTIFYKMIPSGINLADFIHDLSIMRNLPYMRSFFRPICLGVSRRRDEVYYWMLKLGMFRVLYEFISFRSHSSKV